MGEPTLAQRLGYAAEAKLVIINADDLGSCHSANVGVFECLATGTVTSATLMVPCPWAREARSRYRGEDIGVHLTLNAEYELYRWGPITHAPSLLGGDGGFPGRWRTWGPRRPRRGAPGVPGPDRAGHPVGLRRQPPRRPHGHPALRPEFFDVYLELAMEFRLPLRMVEPGHGALRRFSRPGPWPPSGRRLHRPHPLRPRRRVPPDLREGHRHAASRGDRDASPPRRGQRRTALAGHRRLGARVDDYRIICEEDWVRRSLVAAGATLIGYRPLRELARAGG